MVPLKYIPYQVLIVYIAYLLQIEYYGESNGFSCNIFNPTTEWLRHSSIFSLSAYFTGALICINRLVLCEVVDKGLGIITAYHGSLALMLLSLIGTVNNVFDTSKLKCIDFIGVFTESGFYADWTASFLIMLIVILCIDEKLLNLKSYSFLIACVAVTAICMATLQSARHSPYYGSLITLALSCFILTTYASTYYIISKIMYKNQVLLLKAKVSGVPSKEHETKSTSQLLAEQMLKIHKFGQIQKYIFVLTRQQMLLKHFRILWSVFPSMYVVQLVFSVQYAEFFIVVWKYLSMLIKLSFIAICMDSYLEISHPLSSFITREQFSNESRRYYLGYIFQEIYAPLMAIFEGIQSLQAVKRNTAINNNISAKSSASAEIKKETYYMMNDATCSIGETLNDAMTLLKIEEGHMKLLSNAFTIPEVFAILQKRFASMLFEKSMRLQIEIPSELQQTIYLGDNIRLIHVLSNIVLNAIQFSYENSIIQLVAKAESEPYYPNISAREMKHQHPLNQTQRVHDTTNMNESDNNSSSFVLLHQLFSAFARMPSISSLLELLPASSGSERKSNKDSNKKRKDIRTFESQFKDEREEDAILFDEDEKEDEVYQLQNINFSIIDYGKGIPKKDQQLDIFQPFRILKCNSNNDNDDHDKYHNKQSNNANANNVLSAQKFSGTNSAKVVERRLATSSVPLNSPTHKNPRSIYDQESNQVNHDPLKENDCSRTTTSTAFHPSTNYEDTIGNGHGLGLAICREIIKLLNGYIYYDSIEGEGTTFHVLLPLRIHQYSPTPSNSASIRTHLNFGSTKKLDKNFPSSPFFGKSNRDKSSKYESERKKEMCYIFPHFEEPKSRVSVLQETLRQCSSDSLDDNQDLIVIKSSNDLNDILDLPASAVNLPSKGGTTRAKSADSKADTESLTKTMSYCSLFSAATASSTHEPISTEDTIPDFASDENLFGSAHSMSKNINNVNVATSNGANDIDPVPPTNTEGHEVNDYFLHALSSTRSHIDILFSEHTTRCRTRIPPPTTPNTSVTSSPLIISSKSNLSKQSSNDKRISQPFLSSTTVNIGNSNLHNFSDVKKRRGSYSVGISAIDAIQDDPVPTEFSPSLASISTDNNTRKLRRSQSEKLFRGQQSFTPTMSTQSSTTSSFLHTQSVRGKLLSLVQENNSENEPI